MSLAIELQHPIPLLKDILGVAVVELENNLTAGWSSPTREDVEITNIRLLRKTQLLDQTNDLKVAVQVSTGGAADHLAARITQAFLEVNSRSRMSVLVHKYTRAKLTPESTSSRTKLISESNSTRSNKPVNSEVPSSRSKLASESASSRNSEKTAAAYPPSTTSTRVSSSTSGRPYATAERRASITSNGSGAGYSKKGRKPLNAESAKSNSGGSSSGSGSARQSSADSGIAEETAVDAKFILPPRITSYYESECYLMSLPRCDQFVNHLVRNLRQMMSELKFTQREAKDQVHRFAPRLHRLTQELVIAFPRSASLVSNSPRFQEFLRLAVENVVMRFVHDRIFPVICHLSHREDRDLLACARYLHDASFSTDQLGLPEDFCAPLFAAVVELASLDMRTTPLDRLTCIYDTVQQINVHIRDAVTEAHPRGKANNISALPALNDHDLVLLLATVIVQARPMHLMSTLNYADLFAWTVPIDMIEIVSLMSSAADFVRNIQPKKLLPSSGKLKREVSMEEIIQLTDEVQQIYDRQGHRLEPLRSALDLHRERFAQRLEQSSADRTRRQEEAWARLDRCPTPVPESGRVKSYSSNSTIRYTYTNYASSIGSLNMSKRKPDRNPFKQSVKEPGEISAPLPTTKTLGGGVGEIFREIFSYDAALPLAPTNEGVQVTTGLSTFTGVFLPSVQNIIGVQLFIRLTWIAAEAGLVESFQIVLTCCMITFTTAISISAIATNGPVAAGGAYYMINRCLGPEFGGATGILFYLATTFGAAMYTIGAVEILLLYLGGPSMVINFVSDPTDNLEHNFRLYGTILLLILALGVYMGVMIVSKFAVLALISVFVSLLSIYVGIFMQMFGDERQRICVVGTRLVEFVTNCTYEGLKAQYCKDDPQCDDYLDKHYDKVQEQQAFPGLTSGVFFDQDYHLYSSAGEVISWSYERAEYKTLYKNPKALWVETEKDVDVDFLLLLGVFFPAVSGILAGSNRSGDLKKASHSIPVGTISAVIFTSIIYLSLLLLIIGTGDRLVILDKYGVSLSPGGALVLSYMSWPLPIITSIGALLSTVGAGLQSLTGAPRLLQAIAKDGSTPLLNPFAVLSQRGEPARALGATLIIAEMCLLIGNLDRIAPLLSMFFLLFYAGVNLACTVMSLSSNPGWRPTFKYYHWSVSLVGVVLSIGVMFSIQYIYALIATSIFVICFYGIKFFGSVQEWGTGVRGLALSFATQSLLKVSQTYIHTTFWRPQFLILINLDKAKLPGPTDKSAEAIGGKDFIPRRKKTLGKGEDAEVFYEWKVRPADIPLFNLAVQIKQGSGLAIGACVLALGSVGKVPIINKLKEMVQQTMRKQDLDGLAEVCVCKDMSTESFMNATSSIIQLTGLGVLRPNTVMVNFPDLKDENATKIFKRVLTEAVAYEVALIVPVGGIRTWDGVHGTKETGFIDMVLLNQHDTGLVLMTAYLIQNHPMWYRCKLRVLIPVPHKETDIAFGKTRKTWMEYLTKMRIKAQVLLFSCEQTSLQLNEALRFKINLAQTKLTLMSMRRDPERNDVDSEPTEKVDLDLWLVQCRQRIRDMENCIFLWNAGMAVIYE